MHGVVLLEMVKSRMNETYLPHVIDEVEGKSKGPNTLVAGPFLNKIKPITSGSPENLIDREAPVSLPLLLSCMFKTNFAGFLNKKVLETAMMQAFKATRCTCWFCQLFMIIPAHLKSLLWYKQEEIYHSRWLTTANGYLRKLLFHSSDLTTVEKIKLSRFVSYIVSVYLPLFLMTHLKPHACEGPFVTLFQKDLLLAFEAVDSDVCKVVNQYFLQHANSWLSPPHKLL